MKKYTLLPLENLNVLCEKPGSVAIDFDHNLYVSHNESLIIFVPAEVADFADMSNAELNAWIAVNVRLPE